MISRGVGPNEYTISAVLTACRDLGAVSCVGASVHGTAVRRGVDGNAYVENALLDMYASCCGIAGDAEALFEQMAMRTVASWTTMIAAYTRRGDGLGGIALFKRMIQDAVELNAFTCSVSVHACTLIGVLELGRQFHGLVLKVGHDSNIPVSNSLLSMYSRCTSLSEAHKLFDGMPQKDLITWNTMIASLERSNSHGALLLFLEMVAQDLRPNSFTFSSIVAACANLAALSCGQQVHGAVLQKGFEDHIQIANALIDMYAKCGSIVDSRRVFEEMTVKDLVSWTTLMTGYGMHGFGYEAIELFNQMLHLGIQPDTIVFMGVINACSHSGLVDPGLRYFNLMETEYNESCSMQVYGCVVDLLGRAGRLVEAYKMVQSMPFQPDELIWGSLLGACKMHKNAHLGILAAQKVLEIKPNDTNIYVSLANMYAAGKEWGEFAETMKLLRVMGSKKEAGISWVEVRNEVCSFASGDRTSIPHIDAVYEVLGMLVLHSVIAGDEIGFELLVHEFTGVA